MYSQRWSEGEVGWFFEVWSNPSVITFRWRCPSNTQDFDKWRLPPQIASFTPSIKLCSLQVSQFSFGFRFVSFCSYVCIFSIGYPLFYAGTICCNRVASTHKILINQLKTTIWGEEWAREDTNLEDHLSHPLIVSLLFEETICSCDMDEIWFPSRFSNRTKFYVCSEARETTVMRKRMNFVLEMFAIIFFFNEHSFYFVILNPRQKFKYNNDTGTFPDSKFPRQILPRQLLLP